jgi:hypothetical protein
MSDIQEIFDRLDAALALNQKCAEAAEQRLRESITRPLATPQTPQQRQSDPQPQLSAQDMYDTLQSNPEKFNKIIGQLRRDYGQEDAQSLYNNPQQYQKVISQLKTEYECRNELQAGTGYGADYLESQVVLTPAELWQLQMQRERGC